MKNREQLLTDLRTVRKRVASGLRLNMATVFDDDNSIGSRHWAARDALSATNVDLVLVDATIARIEGEQEI